MALIKCPECGNSISDKAEQCPYCGLPSSYFNIQREENNNESIDYGNLSNILVSFDSDYYHLFSANHYITHRDEEKVLSVYGQYSQQLDNPMILDYIKNHAGEFRVDVNQLNSFRRKMHTLILLFPEAKKLAF